MADVITRFKLETNQFDSALRNASNSLVNITKQLSLAGKDFDKFAQEDIEVARSLGQVESGANNLKDKLRDLVSAYNNVARAYNNLTKDQQQGDFGKAMAASLDQLQTRITQTKNELYGMSDSTKQAGTGLGSLNDIFGTSITKLAGWGAAIAAAKGALDVAKDAFFASEQNIDSWGQAVEAGQAVYESFLTSINSGDVSGFLSRIGQITNAAIEAYNALDQLNTQKTIQSPQVAKLQSEITRMRTILQTGRFVESADGRREISGLKTGDVLSKEQLNNVSKRLEKAMNELAGITSSQVNTATKAIDKLYAEQAAVLGVSKNKFQQATSSWENFQAAMDNANEYERWKKKNTTYTTQTTSTGAVIRTANYDDSKNPFREWSWLSRFKDDGERFQRLVQEIQNMESAKSSLYSQYGQAYRRINRAEGVNPYGSSGSGKAASEKTDTELKQNEAAVAKLTEEYQKLATDAKTANDAQLSGIKERQAAIQTEIANLKTRNEELKKFAAEAQGIQVNIGINSSLPDLTAKLKELQAAQSQALTGTEWQEYQKQIEQVSLQIDAMKGKWKEGMKATISVNTEAIQKAIGESSKLQDLITKPKKQTSSATVESNANHVASDASKLEDIVTKPKKGTATIDSNIKEVAADASNLEDVITKPKKGKVTIESNTEQVAADASKLEDVITKPKTGKVTITADTSDAKSKIGEVDAMIGDKTAKVTFTADNAEVLQKAAQIDDVQIDPKTLTVTALTAEAENALSNIEGLMLQPKELDITADVQKILDSITQIDGVTVDPKTMEITANTAEAYAKLQELFKDIEGSTVQFEVVPNLGELSNNNITAIISDIKKKIDGAEIGSDLYNNLTERLADATAIGNLIKIAIQNGLDTTQFDFTDFWANIIKGEDIPDTQLQSIVDRINNYLQEKHIELNLEVGTVTEKNEKEGEGENKGGKSKNSKWKKSQTDDEGNPYAVYGLGKMSNGMSSLVSSVEQLGIELPQGLKDIFGGIQAVTSILTSIMTIVEAIEMLSSATSFMPFFAQGGIIPHAAGGAFIGGSHFSGDVTPVLANAGELILNKASQGNLVSQLQTNETNTGNVAQPFITGEQIYLGLNNYLRRIGKGELLTARR